MFQILQSKNISEELLKTSEPMILSNVGWLGEGDGWPHGRMFPWVETDGQTTPASATTQSSNGHPPRGIPTINDIMQMSALLLFWFLDTSFCLILNRIRVPGLVWSGRYRSQDLDRLIMFFDRDASLHCDFDTQGEEIYSVKWYKVSLLVYFGS